MRVAVIGILIGLGLASQAFAQAQPTAPPAASEQARPEPSGPLSPAERALIEAARETAKATRESVDYARVVPDILQQILAKLDKIEDKLDKVENAVKAQNRRR